MKRQWLTLAALAVLIGMLGAPAKAAGPVKTQSGGVFTLQPGETATFSNVTIDGCHSLQGGLMDVATGQLYELARTSGLCDGGSSTSPFPVSNAGSEPMQGVVYLYDESCGITYFSDGQALYSGTYSTARHAKVAGRNPYDVSLTDAGDCSGNLFARRVPRIGEGNFNVTVTIAATPT